MTRRLLSLAALLSLAPAAIGQTDYAVSVSATASAPASTYAGLYATDGGMIEVRAAGADIVLLAHGAPVAARLASLAPVDPVTDARAETLLDAWTRGDFAPFVAAARPTQRGTMERTLAAYHAALVRGHGDAVAGRVIGTFTQVDGRRVTLVQMVFERAAEWAAFVWDESGALVTVHRGLPPVEVGSARATGADAFAASGTPVQFEREPDGRVHAVRVGQRLTAVR